MTPRPLSRRTMMTSGLLAAGFGSVAAAASDLPWELPPLRTVQVGGQTLAYFETGSGPPLVLVHGMSGSAALEWGRVIGPLSKRHRVIAPYQIGFAPSGQPADLAYDARTFVDSLGGLLRALHVRSPILVGESFGGWVVGQYAVAQAAAGADLPKIKGLVIVDGAVGIGPADRVSPNAPSLNDPAVVAQVRTFFATQSRPDTTFVRPRAMPGISRDAVTAQALAAANLPTLIIWGEGDQLLPVSVGRNLAAAIPRARLAIIPNCGHIPSVEQPEAFLRHLIDFA
jgi:2-hydroxy-6-oxonona-2,4-dienedioate hydrolase